MLRANLAWQRAIERCFRRAATAEETAQSRASYEQAKPQTQAPTAASEAARASTPEHVSIVVAAMNQASSEAADSSLRVVLTELQQQAGAITRLAARDLGRASRLVCESLHLTNIGHRDATQALIDAECDHPGHFEWQTQFR